jgi:murein DD-endopeptidase MepM/ murein hydrolase activator NlpD
VPPPIVRDPPPGVRPEITGRGYVFPVYGPVSFSEDFGAPRASTGWHHGTDVFASLGAPVLAVAAGTVFSVGWNTVGGWRLWLRDEQGNEFYYAHLSAYSPLALDGARVAAGDVLGFVGDTGDAQGTPYHLHFEVHPAALLGLGYDGAIDPYEYLLAWQERRDAGFAAAALASGPAPQPGAVLLEAEDISTASGLEPGALERALGLGGEGLSSLVPPLSPALLAAGPGFQ